MFSSRPASRLCRWKYQVLGTVRSGLDGGYAGLSFTVTSGLAKSPHPPTPLSARRRPSLDSAPPLLLSAASCSPPSLYLRRVRPVLVVAVSPRAPRLARPERTASARQAMPLRRGAPLCRGRPSAGSLCAGGGRHGSAPARSDLLRRACFLRPADKSGGAISYRMTNSRWRPVFALETGGSPNSDGEDFEEDSGFLGRTRLGRLVQAAGRQLLEKLNSARSNSPTKIFLVLLGFYTANALATILGQTGDWDVLVAGVVVAAIEGIGMLMYRKAVKKPPGRFQSLISMVNFWKAGVCLGLFVDAFKLGS